jgi:hypothetical protein
MHRIHDYFRFLVWQAGLGYLALWAVTIWALDYGPSVFGSGGCRPDEAKVLFYWICEPDNPLSILAAIANTALTVTLWSPVYIAAATVRPDAIVLAVPIVATHVVGLPAAIFVAIRMMLAMSQAVRRLARRPTAEAPVSAPPVAVISEKLIIRRLKITPARSTFGLRGTGS